MRVALKVLGSLTAVAFVVATKGFAQDDPKSRYWEAVPKGLSGSDAADYHHLSQGSDFFPYEWLLALKSANFKDARGKITLPYLDKDNSGPNSLEQRFRIIPDPAPGRYLLPYIGLSVSWNNSPPDRSDAVKGDEAQWVRDEGGVKKIKLVGNNCSLCHSGAVTHGGRLRFVEGAPGLLNVRYFFQDLVQSTMLVVINKDGVGERFLTDLKVDHATQRIADIKHRFLEELGEQAGGIRVGDMHIKVDTKIGKRIAGFEALLLLKGVKGLEDVLRQDKTMFRSGKVAIATAFKRLLRLTYGLGDGDNIGELEQRMDYMASLAIGSDPELAETNNGYGRSDAFGRIGNLFVRGDEPVDLTGPTSYPWLWAKRNMALVHYTSNTNSVLLRNIGESLSLGAVFLNPDTLDTTANLYNMNRLEHLMYEIEVPQWNKVLPEVPIRQAALENGERVYRANCARCHSATHHVGPTGELIEYKMFKLATLRTDEHAATNVGKLVAGRPFSEKMAQASEKIKRAYYAKWSVPEATQAEWEQEAFRGRSFFRDTLAGSKEWAFVGFGPSARPFGGIEPGYAYPARYMAGIAFTAPYLHNGSVPTLADLLAPEDRRPRRFLLYARDYDPVKVGYVYQVVDACEPTDQRCFDTSLPGNSNFGHSGREYGTELSEQDKQDLIEYLKVLPPEPEYDSWSAGRRAPN